MAGADQERRRRLLPIWVLVLVPSFSSSLSLPASSPASFPASRVVLSVSSPRGRSLRALGSTSLILVDSVQSFSLCCLGLFLSALEAGASWQGGSSLTYVQLHSPEIPSRPVEEPDVSRLELPPCRRQHQRVSQLSVVVVGPDRGVTQIP